MEPAPGAGLCAGCHYKAADRACVSPGGRRPEGCPMDLYPEALAAAATRYEEPALQAFARAASLQEAEGYAHRDRRPFVKRPCKPRIEEIGDFAARMGYRRLGLAACVGLLREAQLTAQLLRGRGFEVVAALCKLGGAPKESLGLRDEDKIRAGQHESMCNPVGQALVLNAAGAELNVVLGLCVGHDALFFQHAAAPCTVLAAKDRVTGHNPLAALYTASSYYERLK